MKHFQTEEHKRFLRDYFLKKNLSKSEVEVVILVIQGLINKEVANRLCVAEKTIKFHLGNAYKKLNISRRSQLIWTLPLTDFVQIPSEEKYQSEKSRPSHLSTRRNTADKEESIPSGISTVEDMPPL